MVTPAELRDYETRSFRGHGNAEVFKASLVALRSQGYQIVSVDPAGGRIKTGPKLVVVHAARTGAGTAIAAGDSVAWTLDVSAAGNGATVHAEPRLYSAGQAVEATRLNHDYADRLFATLYREIEDNLSFATTTSAVTPRR
jgi:hypothetical protein